MREVARYSMASMNGRKALIPTVSPRESVESDIIAIASRQLPRRLIRTADLYAREIYPATALVASAS